MIGQLATIRGGGPSVAVIVAVSVGDGDGLGVDVGVWVAVHVGDGDGVADGGRVGDAVAVTPGASERVSFREDALHPTMTSTSPKTTPHRATARMV